MGAAFAGPVFFVTGNLLSSVALILVNKRVIAVDKFHFMSVLSGVHFYFSFVACCLLLCCGFLRYKPVNNYLHLLRIALGSLGSVIFMNFNLATNSVGFYQISKLACIPITLLLETALGRRQQQLTVKMVSSLLCIMVGMGLVAVNEVSFNFEGFVWALCGVLCSSCAQIFFGPLQKELNLDALQMLFHLSPILTLGSFATIPLFEDIKELLVFQINQQVVVDVGASCCMAVLLNTSNYLVLSWASPLTYQVLGHIKSIVILVFGVLFYDAVPSRKSLLGMSLAMVGVIIYTEENRQQQKLRNTQYLKVNPEKGNTSDKKDKNDKKDKKDKNVDFENDDNTDGEEEVSTDDHFLKKSSPSDHPVGSKESHHRFTDNSKC